MPPSPAAEATSALAAPLADSRPLSAGAAAGSGNTAAEEAAALLVATFTAAEGAVAGLAGGLVTLPSLRCDQYEAAGLRLHLDGLRRGLERQ